LAAACTAAKFKPTSTPVFSTLPGKLTQIVELPQVAQHPVKTTGLFAIC
jgi:hypothetical protein